MIENIQIPSSKGYIEAIFHKPPSIIKGAALLLPGYLDSKDYDHLVALGEELASYGYIAIRFDPTGTWESSGTIENYTITQYLSDIDTVLEYVQKTIHPDKILLMGHSMGGMLTLLYAAHHKNIDAVISLMTPYAFVRPNNKEEKDEESDWYKNGFKLSTRNIPGNNEEKREYKVPYSIVKDSYQYNVLNDIKNITASILLIAGEKDNTISLSNVKLIYDKANQPKKLIIMTDMGHSYRQYNEKIRLVNKEIIKYLTSIDI